jgi:hypothetical protein
MNPLTAVDTKKTGANIINYGLFQVNLKDSIVREILRFIEKFTFTHNLYVLKKSIKYVSKFDNIVPPPPPCLSTPTTLTV